jgi:hypothetical protein
MSPSSGVPAKNQPATVQVDFRPNFLPQAAQ